MSQWIKCSERMPPQGKRVVVTNGNEAQVCFRDWDGLKFFWEERRYGITIRGITHWMPLPGAE